MQDIKIVIGANFGDEGKGLMTDYFCHQAFINNKSCIVALTNGGAQRGHTVNMPDGKTHVFKHFGSGTFSGAATYYTADFILNPMQFAKEYKELVELGCQPIAYTNILCRWSTPYDMILNQIVEAAREDKKHGSCGMGIWETIYRDHIYRNHIFEDEIIYSIHDFNSAPHHYKYKKICNIRDNWFIHRLKEYHIDKIPDEWIDIVYSEKLIEHFIEDIDFFCKHSKIAPISILKRYDTIVFENGQGLLLDQNNTFYGNNTTPSNTGVYNSAQIIKRMFNYSNIEICYVTRPYMTRHGAGKFITECNKELINPYMFDETNITNQFQDNLRYGHLDINNLNIRIQNDLSIADNFQLPYKSSIAVTHMNEYTIDTAKLQADNIYTSTSRTHNSVILN